MAGWDEGNVYYTEAGYNDDDQEEERLTRHTSQQLFKEFIRSFTGSRDEFIYRDALLHNPKCLQVAMEDLDRYDEELVERLRRQPTEYLPAFEVAAGEVLVGLKSKVVVGRGELEDPVTGDVQVMLSSKEHPMSIRALGATYISKLVKLSGIVIAASRTKAKATSVTLMCRNCKNVKVVPCKAGLGGAAMPRTCDHTAQPGEEPCPLEPFVVVPDKSKYVDQQTLKLQENPEDVPTGELPRNLLMAVERTLVQKIVPGTRVSVVGIYSIFQTGQQSGGVAKGAVAIRQPYLRVVGMDHHASSESSWGGDFRSSSSSSFQADGIDEQAFKEFAAKPDVYKIVTDRIAPSIFGHKDVKKAVACLLFSGSRKRLPDGVTLRGDINVLLLGDPSTAKSQFLKFVEKTAPIAVYTSGKGSSAAGLTASVIRDAGTREFYLEGGAMVLADGGVVCIDEFDKMRPEDRVAIHEAMEQQTISIAKAGITTVLNSRTSVLAAANPPSGRYDDLKTAQENIDLQTTILSRFDLIFIVKDASDHHRDMEIARHVVTVHATASAAAVGRHQEQPEDKENFLRRYVEYSRGHCRPRLSESAAALLQNSYVKIRQQIRQQASEAGEAPAIPITVRQLEAIVRISESIARMSLSPVATEEHVQEALRLFHVSTLDAARSGVADQMNFTPELRAEMQRIEAQIRRRMSVGTNLLERRLVDDLGRLGMNPNSVRRTLLVMSQRDEIVYKRERRIICLKA